MPTPRVARVNVSRGMKRDELYFVITTDNSTDADAWKHCSFYLEYNEKSFCARHLEWDGGTQLSRTYLASSRPNLEPLADFEADLIGLTVFSHREECTGDQLWGSYNVVVNPIE